MGKTANDVIIIDSSSIREYQKEVQKARKETDYFEKSIQNMRKRLEQMCSTNWRVSVEFDSKAIEAIRQLQKQLNNTVTKINTIPQSQHRSNDSSNYPAEMPKSAQSNNGSSEADWSKIGSYTASPKKKLGPSNPYTGFDVASTTVKQITSVGKSIKDIVKNGALSAAESTALGVASVWGSTITGMIQVYSSNNKLKTDIDAGYQKRKEIDQRSEVLSVIPILGPAVNEVWSSIDKFQYQNKVNIQNSGYEIDEKSIRADNLRENATTEVEKWAANEIDKDNANVAMHEKKSSVEKGYKNSAKEENRILAEMEQRKQRYDALEESMAMAPKMAQRYGEILATEGLAAADQFAHDWNRETWAKTGTGIMITSENYQNLDPQKFSDFEAEMIIERKEILGLAEDLDRAQQDKDKYLESLQSIYNAKAKEIFLQQGFTGTLEENAKRYNEMSDAEQMRFSIALNMVGNLKDEFSLLGDKTINIDVVKREITENGGTVKGPKKLFEEGTTAEQAIQYFQDTNASSAEMDYYMNRDFNGYGYANGDIIHGPTHALVGEAGPEAIIPLSAARRGRGLSLWQKAGQMMGVSMFADGGIVGDISQAGTGGAFSISLGGVNISVSADGGDSGNIVAAIKSALPEVTNTIAAELAQMLSKTFQNMPNRVEGVA